MKGPVFRERPRLLVVGSLVLAAVPAVLAFQMYREAVAKDERVFQATAEVLGTQLQSRFGQHLYFPAAVPRKANPLRDEALVEGQMLTTFDWRSRLPHLAALAYAQTQGPELRGQRMEEAGRETSRPLISIGDELAAQPAVAAALRAAHAAQPLVTVGCVTAGGRLLTLLPILQPGQPPAPRGYVAAWLDLAGFCRDDALSLIRDDVLKLTLLDGETPAPPTAYPVTFREGRIEWRTALSRGVRFSERYGAPTAWVVFAAAGLGAVPALLLATLAGRASRLQAELAAERELGRQQRFFTQSVSHEFRTPLSVIQSGADLLGGYLEQLTPERRREILDDVRDNTRRMSEIVEQVLLLGRIEAGRLALRPAPVNLAGLCREAARRAGLAAGHSRPVTVTAPDVEVRLDTALVTSVLDNLLANALKYSPAGSPVSLRAARTESRVLLTITDQGIGIPADETARVCDPFYRCANVGARPGSGLGLAIVRRCVDLHGGTLEFSRLGASGTTVTVTLPCS